MIQKDIGEEVILKLEELIRELEKLKDNHEKQLPHPHKSE